MKFKEWLKLQETSTGSGDIAGFQRPIFGKSVERKWPNKVKIMQFNSWKNSN